LFIHSGSRVGYSFVRLGWHIRRCDCLLIGPSWLAKLSRLGLKHFSVSISCLELISSIPSKVVPLKVYHFSESFLVKSITEGGGLVCRAPRDSTDLALELNIDQTTVASPPELEAKKEF